MANKKFPFCFVLKFRNEIVLDRKTFQTLLFTKARLDASVVGFAGKVLIVFFCPSSDARATNEFKKFSLANFDEMFCWFKVKCLLKCLHIESNYNLYCSLYCMYMKSAGTLQRRLSLENLCYSQSAKAINLHHLTQFSSHSRLNAT